MPQKRSALKELRKGKKRHFRNMSLVSEMKTLIRNFETLLSENKIDQARAALSKAASKLSKVSAKGIIHRKTSSRKISRLSKKLHKAATTGNKQ